jgi:hypothetical protein
MRGIGLSLVGGGERGGGVGGDTLLSSKGSRILTRTIYKTQSGVGRWSEVMVPANGVVAWRVEWVCERLAYCFALQAVGGPHKEGTLQAHPRPSNPQHLEAHPARIVLCATFESSIIVLV